MQRDDKGRIWLEGGECSGITITVHPESCMLFTDEGGKVVRGVISHLKQPTLRELTEGEIDVLLKANGLEGLS